MKKLLLLLAGTFLGGCYVQSQPAYPPGPPPPRYQAAPPPAHVEAPQPAAQPAPVAEPVQPGDSGPRVRLRPAPTPDVPALTVDVQPGTARRGYEVTVYLRPFQQTVTIYLNGQSLAKHLSPGGDAWVVLLPADSSSGHVEVDWNGQRYRSGYITVTP